MADRNASFLDRWAPRLLSVLRIVAALLYMQHGAQKLFGFLAHPPATAVPLFSFMGLAGVLEFFGGLLVLLGLFTRPVAFISLRADGGGLLHGPRIKGVLAHWDRRRPGGALVLHLLLSCCGRRGRLEPGPGLETGAGIGRLR